MSKALGLSIALAAMLAASTASHANLIQNGSFESRNQEKGTQNPTVEQDDLPLGGWDVYQTMPFWYSNTAQGFELQRAVVGGVGINASDGFNYIELESHPSNVSSSILQNIVLASAGDYILTFDYRPRTPTPGDNLINVLFNNVLAKTVSGPPGAVGEPPFGGWTTIVVNIALGAGLNILQFNAVGSSFNTLGGFIDNVTLDAKNQAPEVPLPAGLLLLLSGLGGLGFLSRSRSKAV